MVAWCALGVVLGNVQNQARVVGRVDPVTSTIVTLLSPVSHSSHSLASAIRDTGDGLFRGRSLAAENEALRAQAQAAELYGVNIQRLEREIAALRTSQGFSEIPGRTRVSADIVGFFPHENRITLNLGQNKGLRPGMPVMSAFGLLAIVQTVDRDRAQALLLSSASIQLGGIVADRNPPPAGMLRGGGSVLTLTLEDPKAPVEVGNTVVTSGFSERIPRGLLIGRVVQVSDNPAFGVRTAEVLPATSIGEIREVFVLR